MIYHGDQYYAEGKAIRNRVDMVMSSVEKAARGADSTIPILAEADKLLQLGKRKVRANKAAPSAPTTPQPRKTRSDALIYKLSPDQRTEITDRLACGASYRKIVELCASWGIKTSLGGLTEYLRVNRDKVAP
ncbi:MAG TPA: hypothetical protein VGZ93_09925 [Candidatus Methylacidiphilales bacterium]|jgi:hypothetical protein|nr:hypothetical protein [Candidatus Methylacidiphilales bacterium]